MCYALEILRPDKSGLSMTSRVKTSSIDIVILSKTSSSDPVMLSETKHLCGLEHGIIASSRFDKGFWKEYAFLVLKMRYAYYLSIKKYEQQ